MSIFPFRNQGFNKRREEELNSSKASCDIKAAHLNLLPLA
jgi:hypothetical protein